MEEIIKTNALSFSLALSALRKGAKIAREGWNGKGMFLFLANDIGFTVSPKLANDESIMSRRNKILPSIAMKTNGERIFIGWHANQTDMLAEDWFIVE
jgi:hypothetical protein